MTASFDTDDRSHQMSTKQQWEGGDQPVSPFALSLAVGLIAASITGSLPGGISFGGGFFAGLAMSLLAIYGLALIVSYRLRTRQERDGATEELPLVRTIQEVKETTEAALSETQAVKETAQAALSRSEEIDKKVTGETGGGEFEIYKDKRRPGEYRWRLRATNGEIIADSVAGYRDKDDALHDIELMKALAPSAVVEEVT